jgi:hypothetical protein
MYRIREQSKFQGSVCRRRRPNLKRAVFLSRPSEVDSPLKKYCVTIRDCLKEGGVQVGEDSEAMSRSVCVQRTARRTEIVSRASFLVTWA